MGNLSYVRLQLPPSHNHLADARAGPRWIADSTSEQRAIPQRRIVSSTCSRWLAALPGTTHEYVRLAAPEQSGGSCHAGAALGYTTPNRIGPTPNRITGRT